MSRFTKDLPAYQAHMRALADWMTILDHFHDDPDLCGGPKQTAEAARITNSLASAVPLTPDAGR